jgi:GNAT superfamily N-acetyltransferase
VEVRRARAGDLELAVAILEEASAWMRERSGGGWDQGQFPAEVASRGRLWRAYEDGDLYLAWEDGRAMATVTLQWEDELFWPDAPQDAGYVHRLAVVPDAHGRGIGRELLRWAEAEARARGKRFLRLDTSAENPSLRRYYEEAGFELKDEKKVGRWDVVLFERALSSESG